MRMTNLKLILLKNMYNIAVSILVVGLAAIAAFSGDEGWGVLSVFTLTFWAINSKK